MRVEIIFPRTPIHDAALIRIKISFLRAGMLALLENRLMCVLSRRNKFQVILTSFSISSFGRLCNHFITRTGTPWWLDARDWRADLNCFQPLCDADSDHHLSMPCNQAGHALTHAAYPVRGDECNPLAGLTHEDPNPHPGSAIEGHIRRWDLRNFLHRGS